jgi:hypothetical protein
MRISDLLPSLRPVTMEDQAVFQRYYRAHPQCICEYTFAQMLLWGEDRAHLWTERDGHLLVCFQKRGEERTWYEPVGPDPARIIRDLLPPSEGNAYFYVSEGTAKNLGDISARATPERFDYVYDAHALRELKGCDYAEKRNFINRARKHGPEVVLLGPALAEEARAMLERWMAQQPREGMASLVDEITALDLAMKHWEALGLFGVGIRLNGQLEAFSFGVEQNETMFVEYFQKSTNVCPGLYPLVLHELALHLPEKYVDVNLEEDLGIPGLRTAKERWNPRCQIQKYAIDAQV